MTAADRCAPSRVGRDSAVITTWVLVSRVTGLAKFVVIGAVLGPTFFGNLYQSTNLIPTLVFQFLTGALFASLLVPPLVRAQEEGAPGRAELLAGAFLGVVAVAFGIAAVALVVAGPLVVGALGLGITDPAVATEQRRVGQILLALVMPQLLFYGLAGTGAAAMNARGRFALAAGAPALENVGTILTLVASGLWWGTGRELGQVTDGQVVLLGVGSTAAVALHALAQWWGARRAGLRLVPRGRWGDPAIRLILAAALPSLGSSMVNALRAFAVLVVANRVAGGAVAYTLALAFYFLLTALIARPVATAVLPPLSRLHHSGELGEFRERLDRSLTWILFLALPAALCMLALAGPLARAATFGDLQDPRAVTMVAVCLSGLALGALGEAVLILHTTASYALDDPRSPFRAAALRFAITSAGCLAAVLVASGPALLLGLAAALSAGDLAGAGYLRRRVTRRLPRGPVARGPDTRRAALAAVTTSAAAGAAGWLLGQWGTGALAEVLALLGAVGAAAVVFAATHLALRSPEVSALVDHLRAHR